MSAKRTARGFTLIEIMIVSAMIGIMSATAFPIMQKAVYRSRASERSYMCNAIHNSIEDVYRFSDRFPQDPAVDSVTGNYNPPLPLGAGKRLFDPSLPGWNQLTSRLIVEGATYYSYYFEAWEMGAPGARIEARGDLDGDLNPSVKTYVLIRDRGVYLVTGESPTPGNEDVPTF